MNLFKPNDDSKIMGVLYAGRNEEDTRDDLVYLAVNVFWEEQEQQLPQLPSSYFWQMAVDTGDEEWRKAPIDGAADAPGGSKLTRIKMSPRSVCVLRAVPTGMG